jgi:hypothetical protein
VVSGYCGIDITTDASVSGMRPFRLDVPPGVGVPQSKASKDPKNKTPILRIIKFLADFNLVLLQNIRDIWQT